jgi:hypothetical protein
MGRKALVFCFREMHDVVSNNRGMETGKAGYSAVQLT